VVHLNDGERLPVAPASSQASEVLKQIIDQILANERKRARIEFIRVSSMFLVFLLVLLVSGIWFARQLLAQLREERRITEQTWRMMAAGSKGRTPSRFSGRQAAQDDFFEVSLYDVQATDKQNPPSFQDTDAVARLEQNITETSDMLDGKRNNNFAEVTEKLRKQRTEIEKLNARLNEDIPAAADREKQAVEGDGKTDFLPVTAAEGLNLRIPVP